MVREGELTPGRLVHQAGVAVLEANGTGGEMGTGRPGTGVMMGEEAGGVRASLLASILYFALPPNQNVCAHLRDATMGVGVCLCLVLSLFFGDAAAGAYPFRSRLFFCVVRKCCDQSIPFNTWSGGRLRLSLGKTTRASAYCNVHCYVLLCLHPPARGVCLWSSSSISECLTSHLLHDHDQECAQRWPPLCFSAPPSPPPWPIC